ncbi:MAG: ABC transporter ATP-binding protein [Desulfobulbaceae bacterium]|nr:MAG: ABC transporter ATP-binding protein [Desulfobulbaceae bacterium]
MKKRAQSLVSIQGMCFTAGGLDILHDINMQVLPGDFISIIGPNGGGKTTLLRLILGLIKPTRGSILVNGDNPRSTRTPVGYVPQHVNHNLSFPVTSLDVVLMGLFNPARRGRFRNTTEEKDRAHAILDKMGIADCADRKIKALSGGQRQRVLIARALISEPELLVLDEPTASIDTKGRTDFYELLKTLNEELTILMVSHDLMIVSSYAKSIVCLNRCMHYHQSFSSSKDVIDAYHSCSVEEVCPLGVVSENQV